VTIPNSTELENGKQPNSVDQAGILEGVKEPLDLKPLLWSNLSELMKARWGRENLTRLRGASAGDESGLFAGATGTRLKAQDTSVGIDVVAACAHSLGVQPWQLLVPDLDPASMPRLERRVLSPQATDLAAHLDRITDLEKRQQAYAVALAVIGMVDDGRGPPLPPTPPSP
jgi:hypothetical protein